MTVLREICIFYISGLEVGLQKCWFCCFIIVTCILLLLPLLWLLSWNQAAKSFSVGGWMVCRYNFIRGQGKTKKHFIVYTKFSFHFSFNVSIKSEYSSVLAWCSASNQSFLWSYARAEITARSKHADHHYAIQFSIDHKGLFTITPLRQ